MKAKVKKYLYVLLVFAAVIALTILFTAFSARKVDWKKASVTVHKEKEGITISFTIE